MVLENGVWTTQQTQDIYLKNGHSIGEIEQKICIKHINSVFALMGFFSGVTAC